IDTFAANGNVIGGHAIPEIVEAYTTFSDSADKELFEYLQSLLPGYFESIFITRSGSDALAKACEVSREFRQKPYVLAISEDMVTNSFLVLSANNNEKFEPVFSIDTHFELVSRNLHHPPIIGQKRLSALGKSCKGACLCSLESFFSELAEQTSAIIIEPSIGVGGSVEPCRNFFHKLSNFCNANGIDLIANETQCGMGRTGSRMFGFQLLNIHPDIVCIGSNLGNGYPIGAAIFSDRFSDIITPENSANLSSCSAALATTSMIFEKQLMRRSEQLGQFMKNTLHELLDTNSLVKDIRGLGLMIELELENEEIANAIHNNACTKGLITGTGGIRKNIIRLTPPIIISGEVSELACKILAEAICEL
ncbi:MAG: aminotransferase class III-fold pyridoxal phosphate-dependent enzyme, partial [Candidatus Rifleibacteriota bacterium]